MSKLIRVSLIALGLMVAVVVAIVGYLVATFDPGRVRQQIVDAVWERTGRTLKIEGNIHLTFFPSLGMAVSGVSLSDPRSDRLFLQARDARASLKLLPLLSRRAEVDKVSLNGMAATVVRSRDGRFNFEDLVGVARTPPAAQQPISGSAEQNELPKPLDQQKKDFTLEIAGVAVENASIDYTDEAGGLRLVLSDLTLNVGVLAEGVQSPVKLSFDLKSNEPHLDLAIDLETDLKLEREPQGVALTGFRLGLKGSAMDITDLDAAVKGDLEAQSGASKVTVSRLNVAAKGQRKENDFRVELDVPGLSLAGEKLSGDRFVLNAVMGSARERLGAQVRIPGIEGTRTSFSTPPMEVSLELERDGRSLKSLLTSRISGNMMARTFELPGFNATFSLNDASIHRGSVDARIDGTARADLASETAAVDLTAQIDESRMEGKVGLAWSSSTSLTFDLTVDRLDVDRYRAGEVDAGGTKPEEGVGADAKPARGDAATPVDFSWLRGVSMDGRLQVGQLKVSNVRSTRVRADIRAADGRLDVNPISAGLYGGGLEGLFSAQVGPTTSFLVKQKLDRVDMGPLLRDAAGSDRLEGRGNISIDVTSRGATASALKKSLNGEVAIVVTDGSIKGMDLAGMAREAKNRLRELKGQKTVAENKSERTDFSELRASFNIRDGVAHNRDLMIKAPLLRVAGEGSIDIGSDRIDYLVKPTVVSTTRGHAGHELSELAGVTIPVRLQGPLRDPKYTIDYSGLALEYGKGLLERARDNMQIEGGGKIEDRLRRLLRR